MLAPIEQDLSGNEPSSVVLAVRLRKGQVSTPLCILRVRKDIPHVLEYPLPQCQASSLDPLSQHGASGLSVCCSFARPTEREYSCKARIEPRWRHKPRPGERVLLST